MILSYEKRHMWKQSCGIFASGDNMIDLNTIKPETYSLLSKEVEHFCEQQDKKESEAKRFLEELRVLQKQYDQFAINTVLSKGNKPVYQFFHSFITHLEKTKPELLTPTQVIAHLGNIIQ